MFGVLSGFYQFVFTTFLVPDDVARHVSPPDEVAIVFDVVSSDVPLPLSEENCEQLEFSPVTEEPVAESETRYGLCPVAVRRERAAELRYEAAARRRAGSQEAKKGQTLCLKKRSIVKVARLTFFQPI